MRETTKGVKNGIQWTLWTQLEDLDFADDLALLSPRHTQMQAKTTTLNKLSEYIGLRIHPAKSKVLRVGTQTSEAVMIGDQPLEDVDAFCYLGSNIDQEGGTSKENKARIGKAQEKTKLRIFNSNVKRKTYLGLRLNFKDMIVRVSEHVPEQDTKTLFGAIGGNMGLFLGSSILTLVEVLEFVILLIYNFLVRRRPPNTKRDAELAPRHVFATDTACTNGQPGIQPIMAAR
ncbi:acid-sensing ion channel 4 [Elysia marginata]|uniref:Acid-sensing ion channel 4 n=1 Tax=Elysia marginata TaxID=1093978 RepID=A0AAV4J2K9_9GAST|nr:acid-sensing ion channel 4 [Elysia marginata]